jgi:dipeptidyl aminopeptidase/acylaminoacyl peptidase
MSGVDRRWVLAGASAVTLGGMASSVWAQSKLPPAPKPEQWAKSPAVQYPSVSPSGNHIAYISEQAGQKTLYDLDVVSGQAKAVNIGAAKVAYLEWVDDTHILVATHVADKLLEITGGIQTYVIVTIYNLQTAKTIILFENVAWTRGITWGNVRVVNYKGRAEIIAATRTLNEDEAAYLYRFSPDSDRPTVLDRAAWNTNMWVVTGDGELIARSTYDRRREIWFIDYNNNGTWKTIYSQSVKAEWPRLSGLSRDGKSLVVMLPQDNSDALYDYREMSPAGEIGKPLLDTRAPYGPLYDRVTKRLAGVFVIEKGRPRYVYDDPRMQTVVKDAQASMQGYHVTFADFANDPRKVILRSEGADDAGSYYYVDFNTKKVEEIGVNYPDIPVEWITAKAPIKYKAADGLEIEAFLTLPPGREPKNLPLIMYPHGGPEAADDISFSWDVQAFASAGYAVLQPNFRGSTGYGDDFVTAAYGEMGRKMQTDLSDGVRHLAKQGVIDPKRVAIVGASYGGYAALAGAAFDPGVYNCAVSIAGLSDLAAHRLETIAEEGGQAGRRTRYYDRLFGGNIDAVSPVKNAAKMDIPILLVHGKQDTVVSYSQSERMAAALKSAGKNVEFITFKGQDHWETDEVSRVEMIRLVTAFVAKHNPAT